MAEQSIGERLEALLNHLALDRVHIAACLSSDWGDLVGPLRDRVASLTIVAPHLNKGTPDGAATFDRPIGVIAGAEGAPGKRARALAEVFPNAVFKDLPSYTSNIWSDVVADRTNEVEAALLEFTTAAKTALPPSGSQAETEGSYAGLRYSIRGNGPPLMLLPLSLAPTQWNSLVGRLSERFCVIQVTGSNIGAVALLENRVKSGYGTLAATILDMAHLGPGENALEVGCGTAALSRGLLARSSETSHILATDLNPFLLAEAAALCEEEGLSSQIKFEEADGTCLPYANDTFDVVFSATVLEEVDADKMLGELVRVTKSGGRVAVITRAVDADWWVNLDLPESLLRTVNSSGPKTGAVVGATSCADASLYYRAQHAGLRPLQIGPQFATYHFGERLEDVVSRLGSVLADGEREEYEAAVERARSSGTLLVCEPFHCLVGEVI
jgi:SAM-dependent methyltransferase